jgi:hypothetical protein
MLSAKADGKNQSPQRIDKRWRNRRNRFEPFRRFHRLLSRNIFLSVVLEEDFSDAVIDIGLLRRRFAVFHFIFDDRAGRERHDRLRPIKPGRHDFVFWAGQAEKAQLFDRGDCAHRRDFHHLELYVRFINARAAVKLVSSETFAARPSIVLLSGAPFLV